MDDILKCNFLNENVNILIKISLKFVHWCPILEIYLQQELAWEQQDFQSQVAFGQSETENLVAPCNFLLPRAIRPMELLGSEHSQGHACDCLALSAKHNECECLIFFL